MNKYMEPLKIRISEVKDKWEWLKSNTARIIISVMSTVAIAVAGAFIDPKNSFSDNVLQGIVLGVFALIDVGYTIYLGVEDHTKADAYYRAMHDMEIYKELFEQLPRQLQKEAEGINNIAKDIQTKGRIFARRWTFDSASIDLCVIVHKFIKRWSNDGNISVIYVKRMEDKQNLIKTVGYANNPNEAPSTYNIERDITWEKAYRDAKLFKENKTHAVYKLNVKEVDDYLEYEHREIESGRYEQCLFIPVMCEKTNMVGLLEIFAKRGCYIANSSKEMDKLIELLRTFTSIFLLLQKSEKAACSLPPNRKG